MRGQPQVARPEAGEWLGDGRALMEHLGSTEGLLALGAVAACVPLAPIRDLSSLRCFLKDYQEQVLLPIELPCILRAFDHACRREIRELVGFDRQLRYKPALQPLATASRRVGQDELRRLRPLRDERMVRRYLEAVERGEANAWHTLVYGLILALYSIPLRQGLLGYALQTTRGFLDSAARSLRLSEADCGLLWRDLCLSLPQPVEAFINQRAAA